MARARVPVVLAGLAVVSLVLGAAMAAGQGSSSTKPLFATLNGRNVLDENGKKNAGDRDGFGSFALIRDRGRVCYVLTVRNIARPVSNSVFRGRATVTGQPSFNVARPSSGNPGAASFCQSRNSSQLDAIFRDPSDYYVDVHTKRFASSRDFTGGALRGQLGPRRSGGTASGALVATISGQNEIGQNGSKGAGDADGYGAFTAIRDGNQLCYGFAVANLSTPMAAHIHAGAANVNGGIVVPLRQPSGGDPGASAGCTTVDATLLGQIFANPGAYYVNVHTGDFPNGAARGQLQRNR
jgi:CHRD domain